MRLGETVRVGYYEQTGLDLAPDQEKLQVLRFVQEDDSDEFIVATEAGILHEMQKRAPQKTFIPAPVDDDTCACSECAFMKLNTLEKLYLCMQYQAPEIILSKEVMDAAILPIQRMLSLS